MNKVFRLLAICTISAALTISSIAWAQTYTQVDYPLAVVTSLNGGPNPQGTSVGSYLDTAGVTHGFTLRNGVFSLPFDPPTSVNTTPNWISPQGVIVGSYIDTSGVSHGFILSGGNYTTVNYPGAAGTVLTSLNPSGEMSGFTCSEPTCGFRPFHSFTVSRSGVFSATFDPPGADSSTANTVNAPGTVVGAYHTSGKTHAYQLYHGKYTTLDFGAGTFTFAGAENSQGDIVGVYFDAGGAGHSFVFSNGVLTSFDPPGTAGFSDASGINPSNTIVGIYIDASGNQHGYIRTP
jgi:hypothetical protein